MTVEVGRGNIGIGVKNGFCRFGLPPAINLDHLMISSSGSD